MKYLGLLNISTFRDLNFSLRIFILFIKNKNNQINFMTKLIVSPNIMHQFSPYGGHFLRQFLLTKFIISKNLQILW